MIETATHFQDKFAYFNFQNELGFADYIVSTGHLHVGDHPHDKSVGKSSCPLESEADFLSRNCSVMSEQLSKEKVRQNVLVCPGDVAYSPSCNLMVNLAFLKAHLTVLFGEVLCAEPKTVLDEVKTAAAVAKKEKEKKKEKQSPSDKQRNKNEKEKEKGKGKWDAKITDVQEFDSSTSPLPASVSASASSSSSTSSSTSETAPASGTRTTPSADEGRDEDMDGDEKYVVTFSTADRRHIVKSAEPPLTPDGRPSLRNSSMLLDAFNSKEDESSHPSSKTPLVWVSTLESLATHLQYLKRVWAFAQVLS